MVDLRLSWGDKVIWFSGARCAQQMVLEIVGGAGLLAESVLVLLLVAPMPSNALRGSLTRWVSSLWTRPWVRYTFWITTATNALNLLLLFNALRLPYYKMGFISNPFGFFQRGAMRAVPCTSSLASSLISWEVSPDRLFASSSCWSRGCRSRCCG